MARTPAIVPSLCLLALGLLAASCTSSADGDGDEQVAGDSTAEPQSTTTTTEPPPVIQGLAVELGLLPGQCYDEMPELTTTTAEATTTTAGSEGDDETTTTTAATVTEPTAPTTTIPKPRTVAVVDCEGTREGAVYGQMCIGSLLEPGQMVSQAGDMGVVPCPGDPEMTWPGERTLRRAAARECLEIFEIVFGEPYALSEVETRELVPSRGVWELGERRIVCSADQLAP